MSAAVLTRFSQPLSNLAGLTLSALSQIPKRNKWKLVKLPEKGKGIAFRRIVHFKDEYTVQPLKVTNLGGRDSVTGNIPVLSSPRREDIILEQPRSVS